MIVYLLVFILSILLIILYLYTFCMNCLRFLNLV
ncbi:hypothetical protein LINGRAHAP2_LOCUS12071 [Linum grandiflorum]